MCTSVALRTNCLYFGRNMDLEYDFGQKIVITPRNFELKLKCENDIKKHYAIIGMAAVIDNYPLYADAANEHGLCMAGLNFPANAVYSKAQDTEKHNITPFELIPYILGKCKSLAEAKALLGRVCIVDVPFSQAVSLTPLHWHIADNDASAVIECTQNGLKIYDNYADTLTNNPEFPCQLAHHACFAHLKTANPNQALPPQVLSKGMGAFGLPGDFSSSSRFVKSAFALKNAKKYYDTNADVAQFFHILDTTAVVAGCIDLQNGKDYYTRYSSCIDTANSVYYYKTYKSGAICAVSMKEQYADAANLAEFELDNEFCVSHLN